MVRASIRPDVAAQFEVRGYVIDEDNDLVLLDVANGLDALATLCEERQDDVPEMSRAMWGGLFRTFSRQVRTVHQQAGFAGSVMARHRAG